MKVSKYKLGWIGIRASRLGRSGRLLKKLGFWKENHAQLNNRNGFNWVRPCKSAHDFKAIDWKALAAAGLDGVAMWITDAQWGSNAAVTDRQWQARIPIE